MSPPSWADPIRSSVNDERGSNAFAHEHRVRQRQCTRQDPPERPPVTRTARWQPSAGPAPRSRGPAPGEPGRAAGPRGSQAGNRLSGRRPSLVWGRALWRSARRAGLGDGRDRTAASREGRSSVVAGGRRRSRDARHLCHLCGGQRAAHLLAGRRSWDARHLCHLCGGQRAAHLLAGRRSWDAASAELTLRPTGAPRPPAHLLLGDRCSRASETTASRQDDELKAAPPDPQNTRCFCFESFQPWPRLFLQVSPVVRDVHVYGP